MFRNRAIQMRLVRTNDNDESAPTVEQFNIDPEQINTILTEQVRNVAIAVGAVAVGVKVVNTLSEIAVIAARSKF